MNLKKVLAILIGQSFFVYSAFADFTGKPFSDDDVRDLIIQGDKMVFDQGQCFRPLKIDPATISPALVGSQTRSRTLSATTDAFGRIRYGGTSTRQTQLPITAGPMSPILKCICPCPYSLDSNNRECGAKSAYFQYPNQYKPKCYREDVQEWEITDFRLRHEIR